MYLELFRLKELPFRLSPDPQFLYLSKHHARAKAYMESTVWFTDGFVVLTGEIGSGKTTLIETFLQELDKDVIVAQISQTQLSPIAFLQSVLVQFGFSPFRMRKAELLATLNQFLVEQFAAGRKLLLIVDEAQNLSNRVLEEIRLLSGVETTKEKTLRIILAGQPELNAKLNSSELVQLAQRVRLRFHLTPLSGPDIEAYIGHRLRVAGSEGRRIFSPEAIAMVGRFTGGIPRLINTLCDTAMMSAYAIDKDSVDVAEIQAAVDELQWVEYSARTNRLSAADLAVPVLRPGGSDAVVGRLWITSEGRTIGDKELRPGRVIIGRTPENDVQIDSKYVSRHHCQLTVSFEGALLEDLNSTNGVYMNGRRVRRHVMKDGEVIHLGRHELRYVEERLPRAYSAPEPGTGGADTSATGPQESLPEPEAVRSIAK
jgi:type II secretory pathway predicted ATPase ExeA